MRYDCFIIWGNGIQYTNDIVSMIRNHPDFDIVFLSWYDINEDMLTFIKKMYECDDAPWEHLAIKTKYLLNSPKKLFFILTRNYNPQISNKQWAKEQCETVCDLKKDIRSKYNPHSNDPRECGPPLPPGVSHQHVIHASDYESQVDHELQVLGFPSLDYFKRYDTKEINIPWHLDVNEYEYIDVPFAFLRIDVIGKGLVPIEETPYFKYLNGNQGEMIEYSKNIGYILKEDHFPDALASLDKNFKVIYLNKLGQPSYPIVGKENNIYRVLDGGHRLAIMKKRDYKETKCILIK